MIIKLKQTENYKSFLQTDTGDVIMQGNPNCLMTEMVNGDSFFEDGCYEVIIRGDKNNSVTGHISHKRQICRVLRGYTDNEVEKLSEVDLDGILRDYRSADLRIDWYHFAYAFCMVLHCCGYDSYHAERLLKEFYETYEVTLD